MSRRRGRVALVVLTALCVSGCTRRPGLNFDCKWVPDTAFAIDLRNEAHAEHLLEDIRVAEELGIRYGDRILGYRLVETVGIVSRHGRQELNNRPGDRQAGQKCLAALFQQIASTHHIAMADIQGARPRLADRGFDLPVTVPVLLMLGFSLTRFIRWIRDRFEADERIAWFVALLFGSLVIPAVVLGIGWLWAILVEIVRVGNEHVGYRALRMDGSRVHFLVLFVLAVLGTWIGGVVSAIQRWRA